MIRGIGETVFAGQRMLSVVLPLRSAKIRAGGRVYTRYYVNIPTTVGELMFKILGKTPPRAGEKTSLPVLMLLSAAKWYHLLDWSDISADMWGTLPRDIRYSLEALGYEIPVERRRIPLTVLATPEEIKRLGLREDKVYTLSELLDRAYGKPPRRGREAAATEAT